MPTLLSVLGVKPFRLGGQEAFARELSAQLGALGWDSVLCFAEAPPPAVRAYLELPNVRLETIPSPDRAAVATVRRFAQLVRRHRPEILHLHYTGFLGPYPWLARLMSVKSVFFTDHSSHPAGATPSPAPGWKKAAVRLINLPLSRVICVSEFGRRWFTALQLLPPDRFVRVYNAVDMARVSPSVEAGQNFRGVHGIPGHRFLVVQVSWMIPEKGIEDLLRAARIVVDRNPDIHFAMVGEGAYRQQYMALTRELGLEEHVTWTGVVQDPLGEGVYSAAGAVCQVSRWQEVFGFVIAEAMAFARPVVATRVGGIPELVEDGVTGFLVPRESPPSIAEAVLRLAQDRRHAAEMGEAGQRVAARKFDLRANVADLIEVYRASCPGLRGEAR